MRQSKFSKAALIVKGRIRKLRLEAKFSVEEGATLLGLSRKEMEDIETGKNYGCHLSLELLINVSKSYLIPFDQLLSGIPRSKTFLVRGMLAEPEKGVK